LNIFNIIYVTAGLFIVMLVWLQEKLSRRLDLAYDNKKGEEDYEKQVADANFRMEILTERASQHYKTSLEKFKKLDEQLQADPRLACLRNKGQ